MTYEYACTTCGHAWEAEQSISAAALTECPSCKQATAKRQVSGGAGFILKGGGWYADLYSSGAKKPAEGSSEGGSSESKGEDKKTADKPKTDSATTSASTTPSAPSGSSTTGSKSAGAASG